jgi:hypothetical protein
LQQAHPNPVQQTTQTPSSEASRFTFVFFSPSSATREILDHLFKVLPDTVGPIGNYSGCAFVSSGTGQFLPTEGANPAIGQVGKPEFVNEDRVEFQVLDRGDKKELKRVVEELKKVHPYEEVVYNVYKLEDV